MKKIAIVLMLALSSMSFATTFPATKQAGGYQATNSDYTIFMSGSPVTLPTNPATGQAVLIVNQVGSGLTITSPGPLIQDSWQSITLPFTTGTYPTSFLMQFDGTYWQVVDRTPPN